MNVRTQNVNNILDDLNTSYQDINESVFERDGKRRYMCIFGVYYIRDGKRWKRTTKANYESVKREIQKYEEDSKKELEFLKDNPNAKKVGNLRAYDYQQSFSKKKPKVVSMRAWKDKK